MAGRAEQKKLASPRPHQKKRLAHPQNTAQPVAPAFPGSADTSQVGPILEKERLAQPHTTSPRPPPDPPSTLPDSAGAHLVTFGADGSFSTPWGNGRWGGASSKSRPSTLFAEFIGATHLLRLEAGGSFVSTRCSDGEQVEGSIIFF